MFYVKWISGPRTMAMGIQHGHIEAHYHRVMAEDPHSSYFVKRIAQQRESAVSLGYAADRGWQSWSPGAPLP